MTELSEGLTLLQLKRVPPYVSVDLCHAYWSGKSDSGDAQILAHEAMAEAARNLKDRIGPLLKDLFALHRCEHFGSRQLHA